MAQDTPGPLGLYLRPSVLLNICSIDNSLSGLGHSKATGTFTKAQCAFKNLKYWQ